KQDLRAAGVAVAPRVLARPVDVELVVRMLDERDHETARDQARHELLDQGRLAAARPAGEPEVAPGQRPSAATTITIAPSRRFNPTSRRIVAAAAAASGQRAASTAARIAGYDRTRRTTKMTIITRPIPAMTCTVGGAAKPPICAMR